MYHAFAFHKDTFLSDILCEYLPLYINNIALRGKPGHRATCILTLCVRFQS